MVFTLKMDCDDRGGFIGVDEYGETLLNGKSSQDRFQMAASSRKSLSVDSGYSKVERCSPNLSFTGDAPTCNNTDRPGNREALGSPEIILVLPTVG